MEWLILIMIFLINLEICIDAIKSLRIFRKLVSDII